MRLGLGIDTGGTYTDAVIYDFDSSHIIESAKSLTVKEDLKIGINNVLDKLSGKLLKEVMLVSLSTTLATNACVEGKGSRGTLILIGCDRDTVAKYGGQYGLPGVEDIVFLDGGHNQQGEVIMEPDWQLMKEKVMSLRCRTDAFGIVQMWGIRNPEFEKKAKGLIRQWTGLPVVCGHELVGELNFLKRAATVLLNAQLIPLLNEFMDAVKMGLKDKGISAPLVIVRGDGSVMSEDFVRERPVETLLSGPAASVIGGMHLSREKNCVVVDMGGTTSDLAIIKEGRPALAGEGAVVGNWKTATKSIYIKTIGLGGDSQVGFDEKDNLVIGPRRVAPLSWLALRWPEVLEKIRAIHSENRQHTRSLCQFFYLIRDLADLQDYTQEEIYIVEALRKGPMSISELADSTGTSIYRIGTERLERLGVVMRSALTPTDIMHLTGDFTQWDTEAAAMGAEIMARRLGMGIEGLIKRVDTVIKERLYLSIVEMLLESEAPNILEGGMSEQLKELIVTAYRRSPNSSSRHDTHRNSHISFNFSTEFCLIGIGAPVHVYLPDVADALNARCVIPQNAAVANAVGAITGNVWLEERVNIKPRYNLSGIEGYDCFSQRGKGSFKSYEDALKWATEQAEAAAREAAVARGAGEIDIDVDIIENDAQLRALDADTNGSGEPDEDDGESGHLLLDTVVVARATGNLKWMQ